MAVRTLAYALAVPAAAALMLGLAGPASATTIRPQTPPWVAAGARGLGLGRALLARLEREAAGRGFGVLRLGTHRTLTEAVQMYRTGGYSEIPQYGQDTHTDHWFEKRLGGRMR